MYKDSFVLVILRYQQHQTRHKSNNQDSTWNSFLGKYAFRSLPIHILDYNEKIRAIVLSQQLFNECQASIPKKNYNFLAFKY